MKKGKLFLSFLFLTHITFAQWETLEIAGIETIGKRPSSMYATSDSIYTAGDGGVYSSFDGISWSLNEGVSTTDVISNDTCLMASSVAGVFYSKYNQSWSQIGNGAGLSVERKNVEIVSSGDKIFVRTTPRDIGDIYSFSMASGIWTKENIPSGAVTLSSNGTDVLVGYTNDLGAYRYDKNQSAWSLMDVFKDETVNEFFQKGDTIVAVYTKDGDSIAVSTDNGKSWAKNLMPVPFVLSSFQINNSILFAANYTASTSAEFYISLDNGSNWTPVIIGFADGGIRDIQVFKGDIYASTDNGAGIYRRKLSELGGIIYNGGGKLEAIKIKDATYQWFFNGAPIQNATERTFQALENGTYRVEISFQNSAKKTAGTQVLSYEYIVSDLTVTSAVGSINKTELFSASYDPITQSIHILSEEANYSAQIEVYTMMGQSLLRKNNEAQNSSLDVSQLQTGTYIVKINMEGRVHTFKIYKY